MYTFHKLIDLFSYLILIIKNFGLYQYWRKRTQGIKTVDITRLSGYYIPIGMFGYDPIGKVETWQTVGGKTGHFELLDYEMYSEPWGMVKSSTWMLVGYDGIKEINQCSFQGFLELYSKAYAKVK